MRHLFFVLLVLGSICGCGPVQTDPVQADQVKASIEIKFYDKTSMGIEAILMNGQGKVIAADSTQLYVNDSAMYYFEKQDLYYGKHPSFSYGTENYQPAKDTMLHFRIKFHNDSVAKEIGSINLAGITNVFTLKDPILNEHNKTHSLLLPIRKAYTDSIVYYQSYTYLNENNNITYAGGPYDSLAKQLAILEDTNLLIHVTYFQRPNVTVDGLGYQLIQYRVGKLLPAFASSSIHAKALVDGIIPLR
jgi:hypothetical protein